MALSLDAYQALQVRQRRELAEIVLNWESRNKYELLSGDGQPIGFAASKVKACWRACFARA